MNEATVDGVRYVARKSPRGTCAGCSGYTAPSEKTNPLCLLLPACGSGVREDGRSVVWVKEGEPCSN